MCTRLYCDDPLTTVDSVRCLLEFIPIDFLVLHDNVIRPGQSKEEFVNEEGHTCLCSVNIPGSFTGNRKWKVIPDDDGMLVDWIIVPRNDVDHC